MKKTVLALLILFALLMLFSCSSDKVEPPTPTRPDLDLPIPGLTEDIGFYPYPPDSSHWQHDPDPFDEIRIYGGLSGKDFASVAIERGSCTLTVQVCHTVSQSELRALGIKDESNIIVNTTYTVSNLKVSPSISSDPNEKMLSSDEYSIVAYQEVTSPDGRNEYTDEYYEARYQQINDSYAGGEITEEQYKTEMHLLTGGRTVVAEGKSFKAFAKLDAVYGTCTVISARWGNENGYENTLTYTYRKNGTLEETVLDTENKNITTSYNKDGKTEYQKKVTENAPDGSILITSYVMNGNGELSYVYEYQNGFPYRTSQYYQNGQLEIVKHYGPYYVEMFYNYYEDGNLKGHYCLENGEGHYKAYYPDGKTVKEHTVSALDPETNKQLYTVSASTWYENGTIQSVAIGNENGFISQIGYYSNGKVKSRTSHKDDGSKDYTETYYADGQLSSEIRYGADGTEISKKTYESNGALRTHVITENGKTVHSDYYDDGKTKHSEYVTDHVTGDKILKLWNANGSLSCEQKTCKNKNRYETHYGGGIPILTIVEENGSYTETSYYAGGAVYYVKVNGDSSGSFITTYYTESGEYQSRKSEYGDGTYMIEEAEYDGVRKIVRYRADDRPDFIRTVDAKTGKFIDEETYNYDHYGRLMSRNIDHIRDGGREWFDYNFHGNGELSCHTVWELGENGEDYSLRTENHFSEKGIKLRTHVCNLDNGICTDTVYYESGNVKSVEVQSGKGLISFVEYNEDGTVKE